MSSRQIELGKQFLHTLDTRGDLFALVTDDVEIVFPKWGVAKGKTELLQFFQDLGGYISSIKHHPETFVCMAGDDHVAIEGMSSGMLVDGAEWRPGIGTSGRFCTVFEFEGDLIRRARIHLDPDYGDGTADFYAWRRARKSFPKGSSPQTGI